MPGMGLKIHNGEGVDGGLRVGGAELNGQFDHL